MNPPLKTMIQCFDPSQQYSVVERRLPHWSQAGTLSFITWRTWDSIPENTLKSWLAERDAWLAKNGINPHATDWRSRLQMLGSRFTDKFQMLFSNRWNEHLDACHGACVLRQPELSRIVADSLLHFDGKLYELTDFVIMPNHVHLLAAFPGEQSLLQQCDSWKHFTAVQINKTLGRKGNFWQQDGFDHLVRSLEQFRFLRNYLADNPRRAGLQPGEFIHFSKPL